MYSVAGYLGNVQFFSLVIVIRLTKGGGMQVIAPDDSDEVHFSKDPGVGAAF